MLQSSCRMYNIFRALFSILTRDCCNMLHNMVYTILRKSLGKLHSLIASDPAWKPQLKQPLKQCYFRQSHQGNNGKEWRGEQRNKKKKTERIYLHLNVKMYESTSILQGLLKLVTPLESMKSTSICLVCPARGLTSYLFVEGACAQLLILRLFSDYLTTICHR